MTTSTGETGPRPRDEAEAPDESEKPDELQEIKGASWKYVVRRAAREFSSDQCTDLAAALTYYAVLALFPALIALISLVGLVVDPDEIVDTVTTMLDDLGAGELIDPILGPLNALAAADSAAGVALVFGVLTALWSASGYVGSFGRSMNRIYNIGEGRPFWKLRPQMLLVTLVAVVLVAVVLMALVLTGPVAAAVGEAIGIGDTAVTVWDWLKWPVVLAAVVTVVAILYYATPNITQPKFRWISLGACLAVLVWIVASALFGFYVSNFASYNKTYGSLGAVIAFLVWLWITNIALLFGAELDVELERGRELQAGLPAERSLQLPPRDTTNIDKQADARQEDYDRARVLRLTQGETDEVPELREAPVDSHPDR